MVPPAPDSPVMDRSAKAVISDLLARDVVPVLKRAGFTGRGRTYRRPRPGGREVLTVEPHRWNTRQGGAFTVDLGVFLDDLDAFASPAPPEPAEPLDAHECHIRRGIGDTDPERHWWTFDAGTDLPALGAEVRRAVLDRALGAFDDLRTDAGVLAWVRRSPLPGGTHGLRHVYLAASAGDPGLAQGWLDGIVAAAPDPGPERREAARFAARLGLACPAPTDRPTLTAVFRSPGDAPPAERDAAVRELAHKLEQHLIELRANQPGGYPHGLYHTLARDGLTCTADFYGAGAEELLLPLRRAFTKLTPRFAITWAEPR